jgi:SecD/SecF fusion protein
MIRRRGDDRPAAARTRTHRLGRPAAETRMPGRREQRAVKRGNVKNIRFQTIAVLIVLFGSLYFLYPTFKRVRMSEQDKQAIELENPEKYDKMIKKSIKLGLDLSGGMHLVLEVDDSQLRQDEKKDIVDRALQIIRNRVDQFGVSEPTIQREGEKRIIVQLPGLQDAERAKRLIGQTAMLEWRLIRQQHEVAAVIQKLDDVIKTAYKDSLVAIAPAEEEPSLGTLPPAAPESLGTVPTVPAETLTTPPGETTGTVAGAPAAAPPTMAQTGAVSAGDSLAAAGGPGVAHAPGVPLQTASLDHPLTSLLYRFYQDWLIVLEDNVPRVRKMLATTAVREALPRDSEFIWNDEWSQLQDVGRAKFLFLVARDEMVSGANLVNATPQSNPSTPTQLLVSFQFNRRGAREFSRFTGENVGRFTAIVLDGKIKSYPVIRSKIPGGQGVIEGSFTDEEANDLAIVLRAGALPAPMFIREERTVGPSLGADSIKTGIRAALYGLAAVVLFMLIYYKLSGGIASIALILNLVILFGMLAYLGAALTMPGIAGIILTIGMAVDANVLIYERIREELRKAKTIRSAIDAGYDRAFTTILDANLTTLITAVVLWQFGTGPVKGFATTLSIGIIASMFTALVFCRLIFNLWTRSGRVTKLSI